MSSEKQKVLILGATGTVGAYVTLHLSQAGYTVVASGRRKSDNGFFSTHNIEYYSVDVSKSEEFKKLSNINDIDVVVHCAGVMPAVMGLYKPQDYIDTIVTGTLNVLEFMRAKGIPKIIFMQTRADSNYLMGTTKPIPSDIERKFPLTGDHAVYAICKNTAIDLIEHYHHEHSIGRFILRLPTIYAYHPNSYFRVNTVKKPIAYKLLIEKAVKGEAIEIWGDPQKQKEITSVKDLSQIIEKAIISPNEGGVYNVGRGVGVSLDEQIKGIIDVFSEGKKSEIIYRSDMPDARQFVHDISKTQEELGYSPEYDYKRLLEDYKEEMMQQRFRKLWGSEEDYEE